LVPPLGFPPPFYPRRLLFLIFHWRGSGVFLGYTAVLLTCASCSQFGIGALLSGTVPHSDAAVVVTASHAPFFFPTPLPPFIPHVLPPNRIRILSSERITLTAFPPVLFPPLLLTCSFFPVRPPPSKIIFFFTALVNSMGWTFVSCSCFFFLICFDPPPVEVFSLRRLTVSFHY